MVFKKYLDSFITHEVSFFEMEQNMDSLTKGFEKSRVKKMIEEIEFYRFVLHLEKEEEFNLDNLQFPIEGYNNVDELPTLTRENHFTGKTVTYIDLEKVFYPEISIRLNELINFLNTKIPKQTELDLNQKTIELEKVFESLCLKYKAKFGHELPYGTIIPETVISETEKELNNENKIRNLKKSILFWKKEHLTNPELIGDDEISRMIKLLEIELDYLQLDTEFTISKGSVTPFNTNEQKEIFKYQTENWVYDKSIRYAYIYRFMVDELNHKIDFTAYNKFIQSKYDIRVLRNNADRETNYEQLRELMNEYEQ